VVDHNIVLLLLHYGSSQCIITHNPEEHNFHNFTNNVEKITTKPHKFIVHYEDG
jgi:hypothetical protein